MIEVTISEFSARCCELFERVRRTRQPVRVTRDGNDEDEWQALRDIGVESKAKERTNSMREKLTL